MQRRRIRPSASARSSIRPYMNRNMRRISSYMKPKGLFGPIKAMRKKESVRRMITNKRNLNTLYKMAGYAYRRVKTHGPSRRWRHSPAA